MITVRPAQSEDEPAVAKVSRRAAETLRQTGNVPVFERLDFRLVREGLAEFAESLSGRPLSEVYMERAI